MPSTTYQLIEKAMAERKEVLCFYDGFARELCPAILGHTKGQERVFAYQFAGDASEGLPPGGAWKCLQLHKMREVKLRSGPWHTGTSHKSPQSCIEEVDLDVNPQSPYHPRRQLPTLSSTPKPPSKTPPRSSRRQQR